MIGGTAAAGRIRVGTAGWSIASIHAGPFPAEGTYLKRYAARLDCVEINSSFYRPHRRGTYARWAASVPERFRFSVKLPRTMTHERRLRDCADLLDLFLEGASALGGKLAVILVQLPPSLVFDRAVADAFFSALTARTAAAIVCEPRHRSWFGEDADALLESHGVGRVAADPAVVDGAGEPGGAGGIAYYRFHGSPRIYHSDYRPEALDAIARTLAASAARQVWCILDNTAQFHALANALGIVERLAGWLR